MYVSTQTVITVPAHIDENIEIVTRLNKEEVEMWADVARLIGGFNKVKAIKLIRSEFNCGLKEAKYFVEDAMR